MSDSITQMAYDERPIEAVIQDALVIRVGEGGVTAIEIYLEAGQYSYVPWLAIFKNGFLWKRIDTVGSMIVYKEGRDDQ